VALSTVALLSLPLLPVALLSLLLLPTPATLRSRGGWFSPSADATRRALDLGFPIVEGQCEEDENHGGECRWQDPEASPLLDGDRGRAREEAIVHVARDLGANEHSDAVRDEHEEALRLTADRG